MANGKEIVLCISDTHFPVHNKDTFDFLSDLNKHYKPTRIIHIGDEVEWAALSFHEKDPRSLNACQEYAQAFKCMQKLFKLFPTMQICESNHGSRHYRKAFSAGLPIEVVKTYQALWDAPPTVTWHNRIIVDRVIYTHGDPYSGRNAAFSNMMQSHASICQGHTHSFGGVQYSANHDVTLFGMNVGCLIDTKSHYFDYAAKYRNKPTLGCGMIYYGEEAQFIRLK